MLNWIGKTYLYAGMGYDCAGHLRLKLLATNARALATSSSMLTLGGTLPIGSERNRNVDMPLTSLL